MRNLLASHTKLEFDNKSSSKERSDLEHIFHPRSVVVAGISSKGGGIALALLAPLLRCGFKGRVYALNPKGGEFWGMNIHSSLKDIPGPVDYVIVCIPAHLTPQLMEDCVAKGVKVVSIFTAGFSELGDAEGAKLEARIVEIARRGGIRVLGPNCWGIYNPKENLCFAHDFPIEAGNVGFLGQSGGNSGYAVRIGCVRGLRFSKVVSYGNACDIDESDLLEYFAHDTETKIIGAYIEGVKDGRRFLAALEEAARAKPVIIIKGGRKKAGAEAAASHTGVLVSSETIWDTLLKQKGVISVDSIDEMVDVALAFCNMPVPRGRNTAIIGGGGGAAVLTTDACERAGLIVPTFSPEIRQKLQKLLPPVGTILRNPIDTQWVITVSPQQLSQIINVLAQWDGCDLLLAHYPMDIGPILFHEIGSASLDALIESIIQSSKTCNKPMAVALHTVAYPQSWEILLKNEQRCIQAGIPVFRSVSSAAIALNRFVKYYEDRAKD